MWCPREQDRPEAQFARRHREIPAGAGRVALQQDEPPPRHDRLRDVVTSNARTADSRRSSAALPLATACDKPSTCARQFPVSRACAAPNDASEGPPPAAVAAATAAGSTSAAVI